MVGQTGHTPAQTDAAPARIELEDFIEALTPEAQDQVHRPRTGTTVAAPTDDAADVAGFRAAEYEDEFGYKGRPGTAYVPKGGTDLVVFIPDRYRQLPGMVKDSLGHLVSGIKGGLTWPPF